LIDTQKAKEAERIQEEKLKKAKKAASDV